MAEERRERQAGKPDERLPESASGTAAPVVKKKKKRGKGSLIFLLLLLAFGVGTGLHFAGLWNASPLVWEIVPQIPYVGRPLADFFNIPKEYTLTVAERVAYEQNERQKRLDDFERILLGREVSVEAASADIAARESRVAELEISAEDSKARQAEESESATEKELIAQRIKDFNTITARSAAKIVEELREDLAVKILQGLTSDARASILSKLDPQKAARLVDLLASQS